MTIALKCIAIIEPSKARHHLNHRRPHHTHISDSSDFEEMEMKLGFLTEKHVENIRFLLHFCYGDGGSKDLDSIAPKEKDADGDKWVEP